MNAKFATLLLLASVVSSPVLAQAQPAAPAKTSLLSRVKAAGHKATTKAPAATAAKPATAASNKGQGQRTAKSLACSKQADSKNIHGKTRKSFMEHCKKA